jgi:hypothetical protein
VSRSGHTALPVAELVEWMSLQDCHVNAKVKEDFGYVDLKWSVVVVGGGESCLVVDRQKTGNPVGSC